MANIAILFIVIIVALIAIIPLYNSFIHARNKVREAYSTMDVFLKLRFDLVPSLVAVVRGYSSHEANTLEECTRIRSRELNQEHLNQEAQLSDTLSRIMISVEKYPELKADKQFLELQTKLVKIEEDIAFARRYYNGSVREFNNKCETFPNNLFASIFGFKTMPMFAVSNDSERQVQHVNI